MEKIEKEIISEWSEFYIDYKILKAIMYPLKKIHDTNIFSKKKKKQVRLL